MPTNKRPYVPKIKGCYPCARRRIHCDRTGPECRKCLLKGLKCSGLGVEVVLRDVELPFVSAPADDGADLLDESCVTDTEHNEVGSFGVVCPPWLWQATSPLRSGYDPVPNTLPYNDINLEHANILEELASDEDNYLPQPLADKVPLWKRHLCSHFSTKIAFEMVTIDDQQNSWRHLVLPFAHTDDLVMSAVLAVSAFHTHIINSASFLQDRPPSLETISIGEILDTFPSHLHELDHKVIAGLRQQAALSSYDLKSRQSVLITILVLQVGAMVTGRSDFPSIYKMLESAFEALGGEEGLGGGEAADFILSQVYKFRFYGATLLDEKAGLQAISSPSNAGRLLNSLSGRWLDYPEHRQTIFFVNDLVRQAIDLYVEQASINSLSFSYPSLSPPEAAEPALTLPEAGLHATKSIIRVQHFIETLDALLKSPIGASCEQVLIWATFVVASGCVLREHICFFEDVFQRHYTRCGFLNVLVGLEMLRKIWSRRSSDERWTALIAQTKKLVM
ncbi:hypothetical protein S7711_08915 [Stachybotrys chartarum IBT 7711]|uniref:Zn(2)-C6 fungal-type domain-containing protein n=1 Tax=Stachybotrys chartarum (strain CBS 109288 / IBT 7711) TaxID=1280523 RepID=A0A084B1V6_STACB|nr:hypothetical protein S7711_08915 [Stachybotrys chartarum IBT 7711]